MRISDWSSDVCSSDLRRAGRDAGAVFARERPELLQRQADRVRGGRQRARVLQRLVDQLAGQFVEGALTGDFGLLAFELRACPLERSLLAAPDQIGRALV